MLAGTGSDVGKSVIATGLCRIFRQDGYRPAPFKAQNMALNSYATPDGLEIGRAQAVQAEAAGVVCRSDMNPLLLKPTGEHTSQVVLNGRPIGNRDAYEYFRREGREELRAEVHAAYDRLAAIYNPVVMEGAGSIAELNLRDSDLVNMSMARYADAAVILVADIDRGGVFASVYGSVMLQEQSDRSRIKGVIINKFRGDMRLFDEGRAIIERLCGVPVLGVVPYMKNMDIEAEDSVALEEKSSRAVAGKVNVAVIRLDHISNFTDFDVLDTHERIHLYYAGTSGDIADADIIIVPGTKSTIADMRKLHDNGMADAVCAAARSGKTVVGICGGYQMMGLEIADPEGVEGSPDRVAGLGLLPVRTTMGDKKITRQVRFRFMDDARECTGYEIHMGTTVVEDGAEVLNMIDGSVPDGCRSANCMGSYIHGLLDNAAVLDRIFAPFPDVRAIPFADRAAYKESRYDALADLLREYVDIDRLYKIMGRDD